MRPAQCQIEPDSRCGTITHVSRPLPHQCFRLTSSQRVRFSSDTRVCTHLLTVQLPMTQMHAACRNVQPREFKNTRTRTILRQRWIGQRGPFWAWNFAVRVSRLFFFCACLKVVFLQVCKDVNFAFCTQQEENDLDRSSTCMKCSQSVECSSSNDNQFEIQLKALDMWLPRIRPLPLFPCLVPNQTWKSNKPTIPIQIRPGFQEETHQVNPRRLQPAEHCVCFCCFLFASLLRDVKLLLGQQC